MAPPHVGELQLDLQLHYTLMPSSEQSENSVRSVNPRWRSSWVCGRGREAFAQQSSSRTPPTLALGGAMAVTMRGVRERHARP